MAEQNRGAVYFTDGCVRKAGHVCIAAKVSEFKPEIRFARMYFYRAPNHEWGRAEQSWHVASVCNLDDPPSYWALSGTGEVARYSFQGGLEEKIKDAKKYGMLHQIRAIDGVLYVCGRQGQVYRRGAEGWVHVDEGILDTNIADSALHLHSIDGTAANDLYVVGTGGRIRHYDGSSWRALSSPTERPLARVLCTGGVTYACGARGTFLRIAHDAVEDLSVAAEDFIGMAALGDDVYLATRTGLHVFDGRGITALDTGLEPPIAAGPLDARDGQLWSFGTDDLAYYDGERWQRLLHPDNQPPAAPPPGAKGGYRTTDHHEAMKLVKARARKLADTIYMPRSEYSDADDESRWTVRIYDKDHAVAGNFTIERGIVVFAGDLTVAGSLFDCGKVDHTLTVVLGNLRVKNAMLHGEWLVAGDLQCEGLLYENSLNDYTLTVGGDLGARVFMNSGTYTEVRGSLITEQTLALQNEIAVGPKKARLPSTDQESAVLLTRALFPAEYHHSRLGTPDGRKLRAALEAGKDVLSPSTGTLKTVVVPKTAATAKKGGAKPKTKTKASASKAKAKPLPKVKAKPLPKVKTKPLPKVKAKPLPKAKAKPSRAKATNVAKDSKPAGRKSAKGGRASKKKKGF